jgi:DNA-directed RNA polymerase specialized sigma24 family protein
VLGANGESDAQCGADQVMPENSAIDELLRTLQAQRRAFNSIATNLFGRFVGPFTRYGLKEGLSQEEAEDARQMTFNKVMNHLEDYRGSTGEPWMWDIHKKTVVDALRRRGTRAKHTLPLSDIDPPAPVSETDPENVIERQIREKGVPTLRDYMIRCLVWAVDTLSEDERNELKKIPGRRGGFSKEREAAREQFRMAYRECSDRDDDVTDYLEG